MSWNNLIWGGISPLITKFVLESSVNWVRTPNLLKLWGLKNTSSCCLCGAPICSLHHILSNCSVALNGERYTWRHDSVLSEVQKAIHRHVEDRNANVVKDSFPHISSCFVPAGKSVVTSKNQLAPTWYLAQMIGNYFDWSPWLKLCFSTRNFGYSWTTWHSNLVCKTPQSLSHWADMSSRRKYPDSSKF